MIKAVLFDLDETLIDRTQTMRTFLLNQYHRFPALHAVNANDFVVRCLQHQENGYADKLTAYASTCTDFGVLKSNLVDQLFADFKEHYGNAPVLFPDVLETLAALHQHYLIGLVSNGRTKGQTAKIEAAGIAKFFSSICISESVGVKKPDHGIFLKCLTDLSVSPSQAVFVGDNPEADIEPARALGMRVIWRRNEFFAEPVVCDSSYSDISELPGLLRIIGARPPEI